MTWLRDGRDDTITAIRGHARDDTRPCPEVIPPEPGELP